MWTRRQKHLTLSLLLGSGAVVFLLYVSKLEEDLEDTSLPKRTVLPEKANLTSSELDEEFWSSSLNAVDIKIFKNVLKPILIERVVGTPGHETVKNYIIEELNNLKWRVELDSFESTTPDRRKLNFTNIIATFQPDAEQLLVLSCHYDSKLSNFVFIGATDSAVPCAMLLYLAKTLDETLRKLQPTLGLQLIFFDGEEAFINWSDQDSLYGARHLARVLAAKTFDRARNINHLNRMSLFVLLDLIGASSPRFHSYFENTNQWFSFLISIERHLLSKGFLQPDLENNKYKTYFQDQTFYNAQIDDDHKPFLRKGVPVLHLIPYPFPSVWHTQYDNESAINYKTVKNLLKIFKVFTIQYLVSTR